MKFDECTISWRNKPLDRLSNDEMRTALIEALGHAVMSQPHSEPADAFYPTFIGGMIAGGVFCLGALLILHGISG